MQTRFDAATVRQQFPALALQDDAMPRHYLDNPAGTQVPHGCGFKGDVLRVGLAHYNPETDVQSFVSSPKRALN